jgi:glycosyltransferase involved in cell wall biosynthesis
MYGTRPGKISDWHYASGVVWTLLRHARDFDVVYFLMAGVQVAAGVPAARMLGIPSVMKFSGSNDLQDALRCRIGPFEIGAIRKWCEYTMILNDAMVEEAVAAGFDRQRLLWMPNPVDTERWRPPTPAEKQQLRTKPGLEHDSRVIIFVGRLVPVKELPTLIDGFAIAAANDARARLVIVGDGPMRGEIEQRVTDAGLSARVTFTGSLDPDETRYWLQASDIFTLISAREGLPVSLIEAMAVGLPCAVTNIPAITQLITHERNGLCVPPKDPQALGDAFLRLLADPDLRNRFGSASRPIAVSRYSLDTVLDSYEELFSRIVSR